MKHNISKGGVQKKKEKKVWNFPHFGILAPPPCPSVENLFFFLLTTFLNVLAHSKHIQKKKYFSLEKLKTLRKFTPIWYSEEAELPHHPLTPPHPPSQREKFSLHFWTFQTISQLKKRKNKSVENHPILPPLPVPSVENSTLFFLLFFEPFPKRSLRGNI